LIEIRFTKLLTEEQGRSLFALTTQITQRTPEQRYEYDPNPLIFEGQSVIGCRVPPEEVVLVEQWAAENGVEIAKR
jgi:hypothetical protein